MHRMTSARLLASLVGLSATLATVGAAWGASDPDRREQIAGREVAIWLPPDTTAAHPLILFSHGLGGCSTQSTFLMRALAEDGMLVAAPEHADASCPGSPPRLQDLPLGYVMDPANWTPAFYDDRRDDIQELWAALQADPDYAALIDPERVALVGHSLGGYTVLGLAGAWPTWKTEGLAGVVALAPFARPFERGALPLRIEVPVLFQAGAKDELAPASVVHAAFAATSSPACILVYPGAGHLAWTDFEPDYQDAAGATTIAFLNQVFAGQHPIALGPQTDGNEPCRDQIGARLRDTAQSTQVQSE